MKTLRFRCLRCVHCCFFMSEEESPVVFPWEKRSLEELAERHGVGQLVFKPLELYRDRDGRCAVALYRWVIRGFCPFYRLAGSSCIIHFEKPLACRMYPLIVNVETGEIAVSTKCDWVEERAEQLRRLRGSIDTLLKLFPVEGEAAVEAYVAYRSMISALLGMGLERIDNPALCKSLHDADDYVVRYA